MNDLLDNLGESLGGIWDSAVEGGNSWVDAWFNNEADKVSSAAPEENRVPDSQQPAQQPNGQPIWYGLTTNQTLMVAGGGALILMLFMFLMMRGK